MTLVLLLLLLPGAAAGCRCRVLLPQLLAGAFTARDIPVRLAAFSSWQSFVDCCFRLRLLMRKRLVLLQPTLFALQAQLSQQVGLQWYTQRAVLISINLWAALHAPSVVFATS
jgi:hypothetical protein